ncbi:MAG: transketolase [Thermoanaerobacterales bacterium]|jgi:transketolase|nr:transketolase [Thermoanaerobacterales bacterium]
MTPDPALEQRAINVVRGLAMDAPQAARNGHPGTAMALAPLAHVLWTRIMRYDAGAPDWPDRDRFVLSAGHASILLYSMLHLTGYGLTLDDLRRFRQWGSATPGHPEVHHTPGVEVTTGPLGQGFANAVGMGIAERWLRTRFGPELCDHRTYVICSDGDLMEGISHEAASLAGHLRLGRLIYVYDDNRISIDGDTSLTYSDDVARRFESYGWHVEKLGDVANDVDALEAALRRAAEDEEAPSLLILRTHIGWPSPNLTDTADAHGNPLGEDEVRATKEILGLPVDETFWVPDDVLELYRAAGRRGRDEREAWEKRLSAWEGDRETYEACVNLTGLPGWQDALPSWEPGQSVATRKASGACLQALADKVPGLVAGGADLTGNTGTALPGHEVLSADRPGGRQVHFGVREHAMAGVMNGISAHGGLVPVGGTFLVFSDYMRPAVRLAAMSEYKEIFVFSHDSVGLGQDGPTHQPIEHLASLRAMPQLRLIRPADANETAAAWRIALESDGPTALVLTRQDVPVLEGTAGAPVDKGAYVLVEAPEDPRVVLIGTGSEVALCVAAAEQLNAAGLPCRVVSMPSWDLFEAQSEDYQLSVLPPEVPTLAVEAGASLGWDRWADDSLTLDRYGASAPGDVALARLGFTADNVVARARQLVDDLQEDA